MNFGVLDIAFLVPLIIFLILGYRRGFIIETLTIVALLVAVIGCLKLTNIVLQKTGVEDEMVWWIPYLAYIVVFAIIFITIMWLGKILEKIIKFAMLSFVNNILGALVGAFKIAFIFSLFLWITNQTQLFPDNMEENSISFKYIEPVAPKVINFVSENAHIFTDIVAEVENTFDELVKKSPI